MLSIDDTPTAFGPDTAKSPEATPEGFASEEAVDAAAAVSQPLPEEIDENTAESSPGGGESEDANREQSTSREDKEEGGGSVPSPRDDAADGKRVSDLASGENRNTSV